MKEFDIPPKEDRVRQALASVAVLLVIVIVLAILGKILVAGIIFLLGAAFGVGMQAGDNNPLTNFFSKDKK